MTPTPSFEQPETVYVDNRKVSCNGGGGALGHPLVWYEMGANDTVECQYCDKRFVLKAAKPIRLRPG